MRESKRGLLRSRRAEMSIVIKNLTKKYKDVTAVDGMNLEISDGELFALLGVNGAGKTTTIKMLSCLCRPTSGDAWICEKSIVSEPRTVKNLIGSSPQETAIAPNLTVRENLELMAGVYGISGEKRKARVNDVMSQLDLSGIAQKRAKKLSGGWQRRLSIAMALISEPQILFLDEPTLGLDVIARSELWEVVRSLKGKTTVILTTHYLEEAQELSDRIGIMKNGRLLCTGTAGEIMSAAGGICGALLTNLTAWLSGIWFDVDLVGGTFAKIARVLPFLHAVELQKGVLAGDFSAALPHLPWVLGYTVLTAATEQ